MIAYLLACDGGHEFESWFASGASYDAQAKRGLLACPVCGSAKVGKAIMAPAVNRTDKARGGTEPVVMEAPPAPMAVFGERERQLRETVRALRKHVADNSDYVGHRFPEEARQMHNGEIEHRSIWGEASADEARALADEGVEVHPLPPLPEDRN